MTEVQVREAYGSRAEEYSDALGSVEQMHDADRRLIKRWAAQLPPAPVLDAGCGPGHWTSFLYDQGIDVEGLDVTAEFIDSARARFPEVPFRVGSFTHTKAPGSSVSGVLAWYSLIHEHPEALPSTIAEFCRILRPDGRLLIGFFEGIAADPFPHAITTAYYWSVEAMNLMLDQAGLDIAAIDRRQDPGNRPHAAIAAVVR